MKTKIILVHSGNFFPEHLNDCILNLKNNNFEIHLILDSHLHQYLIHSDIILNSVEDYIDDRYNTFSVNHQDINFRDGFWLRVSTRFFLIDNYIKKNNIQNFFYIENDVLLYSDFVDILQILKDSNCDMCISIDSEKRAVPCLIYFKNSESTNDFSNHIYNNRNWNDMENLFIYYELNKHKVINFPIITSNSEIEMISQTGITDSGKINYSNMYDKFQSIFDPQAIGQYLGGLDQRIHHTNTIGFINETTIFNIASFDYIWENNIPYMILKNGEKIKINNLHIHSKNLKQFINKNES